MFVHLSSEIFDFENLRQRFYSVRGQKARYIPFYLQILFSHTTQVELLTNSCNDPILEKIITRKDHGN